MQAISFWPPFLLEAAGIVADDVHRCTQRAERVGGGWEWDVLAAASACMYNAVGSTPYKEFTSMKKTKALLLLHLIPCGVH